MTMRKMGENISQEWEKEDLASELRGALQLIRSDAPVGLEKLNNLAKNGSSLAMMYLGDVYLRGRYGIPTDITLAEGWLRNSACKGSVEGAYVLAWHYLESDRVDEALVEYSRLSNRQYSPATFVLGWLYYSGTKINRDIEKSLNYFKLADKQGHLLAGRWMSHLLMKNRMGSLSWLRGLQKKIVLTIPFIKQSVNFPNSDRLRS